MLDSDADGSYDTLEVEPAPQGSPHLRQHGIPMHEETRRHQGAYLLDKSNPDTLRNDITTIDNALTHRGQSRKSTVAR